jgi:hypothetical protein
MFKRSDLLRRCAYFGQDARLWGTPPTALPFRTRIRIIVVKKREHPDRHQSCACAENERSPSLEEEPRAGREEHQALGLGQKQKIRIMRLRINWLDMRLDAIPLGIRGRSTPKTTTV